MSTFIHPEPIKVIGLGSPILTDDGVGLKVIEDLALEFPNIIFEPQTIGGLNLLETMLDYHNPTEGFIRGHYYTAEFFNGAIFDFWAGCKLNRKEARQAALIIANGDYNPPIYNKEDIVSVKKSKG